MMEKLASLAFLVAVARAAAIWKAESERSSWKRRRRTFPEPDHLKPGLKWLSCQNEVFTALLDATLLS